MIIFFRGFFMYFKYGKKEIDYLKSKDKILGDYIDKIGIIKREVNPDVFYSLVHCICGQQISTKAHITIWNRILNSLGEITPDNIIKTGVDNLKNFGMSYKKAEYIFEFALKVKNREIEIENLHKKPTEVIIKELTSLRGVGIWSAEMILLFCMRRQDVLSYKDLGIQRGIKILYNKNEVTKEFFEELKERYTPYLSVASLYLWEAAGTNV